MTIGVDINIEVARLQQEIETYLGANNTNTLFEYSEEGNISRLNCVTVNAKHNQSFLFHATEGINKLDTLHKLLDYVKNYKDRENSYTVQWTVRGENELNTSYFRSKNILDALDKLNYGRDPNSLVVYSIVLNPLS